MKIFTQFLWVMLFTMISHSSNALPRINSLPSATATIYLDFDGHLVTGSLWNGGMPIACAAPALTDAQITEIFNRVAEDFRPFNVNITSDSAKFLAAPLAQRIRVIVTPTSAWKPNVGGISYIGSFTWGDDTPAFVFSDRLGPNNSKYIAECCSHETGHTLGLSHQSRYDGTCTLTETYHTGLGTGETGWAPIMGNSYGKNMTGWNDGPTPYGCANTQDNLSIIIGANGFGYRTDDYSDSLNTNAYLINNTSFSLSGIIGTGTDKDVYRMVFPTNSTIHMDAIPFNLGSSNNGSNLDIKISLYSNTLQLLRTYDPATTMNIGIDTSLKSGTYYWVVDGTGNSNATNYGSIGSYSLTGFRSALPIREVQLTGVVNGKNHELNWNIIADEPVINAEVEYAYDGRNFELLADISTTGRNVSYRPNDEQTRYYRIKAAASSGQIVYSNIVALRGTGKTEQSFAVSTFINSTLSINATEIFQFRILDNSGRLILTGKGNKGFNSFDMSRQPSGFYVIQLFGTNTKQTERIIKQ